MNIINENPYRILGVYANSKKKIISNNKSQIKAFLQANRDLSFPLDMNGFLPPLKRSMDLVNQAESALVLPNEAIKYAQFWFICLDEDDKNAFEKISEEDVDSAELIWKNKTSMSSLHNLFVLKLILKQYEDSIISYAIPYISRYHADFCKIISDNNTVTQQELIDNVILTFRDNHALLSKINKVISDLSWKTSIDRMIVVPTFDEIENVISLAQNQELDIEERYNVVLQLKETTERCCNKVDDFVDKDDARYTILLNKVASVLLDGSIAYYKNTDADDRLEKSLVIFRYCESISSGAVRERCQRNLSTLVDISNKRPTIDTLEEHKILTKAIEEYQTSPVKLGEPMRFLKRCQPQIISIKEKLGTEHLYYLDISTKIVECVLDSLITLISSITNQNATSDYEKQKQALAFNLALKEAWEATLHLDKFDMEAEYKEKRYDINRQSLYDLIDKYDGFDFPLPNYTIRGCCYYVSDPVDFLYTEEEHFNSCTSEDLCRSYLEKYPHGKYSKEVGVKLNLFYEERDLSEFNNCKTKDDFYRYLQKHNDGKYRKIASQEIVRANNAIIGMALSLFAVVVSFVYFFCNWWIDSSLGSIVFVLCLIFGGSTYISMKYAESMMLLIKKHIKK